MIALIGKTLNRINKELQFGRIVTVSIKPADVVIHKENLIPATQFDAVTTATFENSFHRIPLIYQPSPEKKGK